MKTNYKIAVTLFTAVGLCVVACGSREPAHEHTYLEHEEVLPNCAETGTEFYYSCEGCDQLFDADKNEIEAPVVIPIDPTNHKGTEVLAVGGEYKNQYQVGEAFDMTGLTLTDKCEYCEGRVLSDAEKAKVTVSYPTADATTFTAEDVAKEDLKVTLNYGELHADVAINNVRKKDNAIVGLAKIEQHCGYKPFASLDGVTATYGDIVYTFSESENGDYKTAAELGEEFEFTNAGKDEGESTTYYVKATVAEGADYAGAEEKTTIVITHNDLSWDTTRDDYDFYGCVCQEPYKFEKVPTHVDQEVDVASAALDLSGTDYDKGTVKSIEFIKSENVKFDLGTNVSNLDFSGVSEENHGQGKIEVVVTTPQEIYNGVTVPARDHTIEINLLAVTKYINNTDDFKTILPELVTPSEYVYTYGYFKITANLNVASGVVTESYYSSWSHRVFKGTIDGGNHQLTAKSGYYYGMFNMDFCGTFKNINFIDAYSRRGFKNNQCMLAQRLGAGSLIENCKFTITVDGYSGGTDVAMQDGFGMMANEGCTSTFKDCLFDFSNYDIGALICIKNSNVTFVNTELKAKSCAAVYKHYQDGIKLPTDDIPGFTYTCTAA